MVHTALGFASGTPTLASHESQCRNRCHTKTTAQEMNALGSLQEAPRLESPHGED